jgi:hypothetical protein
MCPRGDFSSAIIAARARIKIEIRGESAREHRVDVHLRSRRFGSDRIERSETALARKTSIVVLAFAKISSQMLSGDFGARVVCARKHHFFLDITF